MANTLLKTPKPINLANVPLYDYHLESCSYRISMIKEPNMDCKSISTDQRESLITLIQEQAVDVKDLFYIYKDGIKWPGVEIFIIYVSTSGRYKNSVIYRVYGDWFNCKNINDEASWEALRDKLPEHVLRVFEKLNE